MCISSLRKGLIKWQASLFSTVVSTVVICSYTGATLGTGSPSMQILLLELGGREERGREKGIRFLDSAFSGGLVLFFFPVNRREGRILEFSTFLFES